MMFGTSKTGAFTALIPCLPMFFSTWETYHTHTLYLGYFNGPTGMFPTQIFLRLQLMQPPTCRGLDNSMFYDDSVRHLGSDHLDNANHESIAFPFAAT
jgi:hypothetical protein